MNADGQLNEQGRKTELFFGRKCPVRAFIIPLAGDRNQHGGHFFGIQAIDQRDRRFRVIRGQQRYSPVAFGQFGR